MPFAEAVLALRLRRLQHAHTPAMHWIRRKLRNNSVFVKATADARPATDADGRVEIVYKLYPGAKIYRASLRNLEPTGDGDDAELITAEVSGEAAEPGPARRGAAAGGGTGAGRRTGGSKVAAAPPAPGPDSIIVYTDGACTGNPGPMGVGAVIIDGAQRVEISEYLGTGTNNIAELTAIELALRAIPPELRQRPVHLHTDSAYSIGLLGKGWKAKANTELVARLRTLASEFPRLHLHKVRGHAGIPENERCDQLARDAIVSGTSRRRRNS